jgi:hypothetical protein
LRRILCRYKLADNERGGELQIFCPGDLWLKLKRHRVLILESGRYHPRVLILESGRHHPRVLILESGCYHPRVLILESGRYHPRVLILTMRGVGSTAG